MRLAADSTLLLFTEGLVQTHKRPIREGMAQIVGAAAGGPRLLRSCASTFSPRAWGDVERDGDVLLLALRLPQAIRS